MTGPASCCLDHKRDIGAVWAAASDGHCVFAMGTDSAIARMPVLVQPQQAVTRR